MNPTEAGESFTESVDRRAGYVSPEEAHQIARRFNASHWHSSRPTGGEVARYSIPADPTRDDDLRLGVFIRQAERNEKQLAALKALFAWCLEEKYVIRWDAAKNMVRLIFSNLDTYVREFEKRKEVTSAAEAVRQQLRATVP